MATKIWRCAAARLLAVSPVPALIAPWGSGLGSILTFHQIAEQRSKYRLETDALRFRPALFRQVVRTLVGRGFDLVSMSELARRMRQPKPAKFVALTFDDGSLDTYTEAFGICRALGVPITIFIATGPMERKFPMWWLGLEQLVESQDEILFHVKGRRFHYPAVTSAQKRLAYRRLAHQFTNALSGECLALCEAIEAKYPISFMRTTNENAIRPEMVAEMHASGLVEVGAHSVTHANLRLAQRDEVASEMESSRRALEAVINAPVRHFAYPYGTVRTAGPREFALCRELGFETAVTTRTSNLFQRDFDEPHRLPRLSMNGDYQSTRMVDLLLSGTVPMIKQTIGPFKRI
jgi:peptidoglycan/xylan/chitin deacetylase (PgdA/CDA1 family)